MAAEHLAPWRVVTAAEYGEGQSKVFYRNPRTSRWWELTLECGHETIRSARLRPDPRRSRSQYGPGPSDDDILPAPARVRCKDCER